MRAEHEGAGLISRRTPSGHRHIIVDYWAIPDRTPAWAAEMKKLMGERKFNREFRRDWESSAGDPFYSEWGSVEKDRRIIPAQFIMRDLPLLRFWDFGFRYPAVLFAQYSEEQNRLWVYREFMPSDIDAHSFAMLVLYLSGQMEEEYFLMEAPPLAIRWLEKLKAEEKYPAPPWFPSVGVPMRFLDFAGPEATQVKNSIQAEAADRTYAQILNSLGINLSIRYTRHKARETVLRSMMRPRPDGLFGLIVDPACDILIRGLNGGIAYQTPNKDEVASDDCVKDGFFEHLHDALGYGVVQVCKYVEPTNLKPALNYGGIGGRTLMPTENRVGEESLGFNELEREDGYR